MQYYKELERIIRKEAWLMDLLSVVSSLGLPDSLIAAGAIRNTVWDVLHGYSHRTPLQDVDVVFFDETDLSEERDQAIERKLKALRPEITWEVVNQARSHILNPKRPKMHSTKESLSYWTETVTSIGVRLENDGSLYICASHGLEDLFSFIVRPTKKAEGDLELYRERMQKKKWKEIWPKLKIEQT